jgi:hypothetical protein
MLIIFAAAFGEIDLLKAGKIFQGSVAGFKQMFLYLQPLLKQSSFTDWGKKLHGWDLILIFAFPKIPRVLWKIEKVSTQLVIAKKNLVYSLRFWILRTFQILNYNEEFDPGSGWTLAAGLTHASRGAADHFGGAGDRRTGEYRVCNLPLTGG